MLNYYGVVPDIKLLCLFIPFVVATCRPQAGVGGESVKLPCSTFPCMSVTLYLKTCKV